MCTACLTELWTEPIREGSSMTLVIDQRSETRTPMGWPPLARDYSSR